MVQIFCPENTSVPLHWIRIPVSADLSVTKEEKAVRPEITIPANSIFPPGQCRRKASTDSAEISGVSIMTSGTKKYKFRSPTRNAWSSGFHASRRRSWKDWDKNRIIAPPGEEACREAHLRIQQFHAPRRLAYAATHDRGTRQHLRIEPHQHKHHAQHESCERCVQEWVPAHVHACKQPQNNNNPKSGKRKKKADQTESTENLYRLRGISHQET